MLETEPGEGKIVNKRSQDTRISKEDFLQAKKFIIRDLEREIQLAKLNEADKKVLPDLGVHPGGGNFLAALGLLCYTEFGGKLRFGSKLNDGRDHASKNFNEFFDLLGDEYKDFRVKQKKHNHDVYNIFRCGLVHEYYVKHSTDIAMLARGAGPGIRIKEDGRYVFVVERYFNDLRRAFEDLQAFLFGTN